MKNQEKQADVISSEIKNNVEKFIMTTQRQMRIQEAMIETLEEMLVLEKKEAGQWRILCIILLMLLIISSIATLAA